jgi:APA family basic amino acid/polyamine antiporter
MMMGMGSIIGTGIFVSIGIAAGVTGPSVLLAIAAAALVAVCNGLSSAQLAANHPVSGGTYEYGYVFAFPLLGFLAGWMFLCAKSASAATAALGFSGYALHMLGLDSEKWLVAVACGIVVVLTLLVLGGIRQSNRTNIIIVSITLAALALFTVSGIPSIWSAGVKNLTPFFMPADQGAADVRALLEACALMFVAFTGYGRIATLGEEVRNPRRSIPRAIELTLISSAVLYMIVGYVAVAAVGSSSLAEMTLHDAAPLELVAEHFQIPLVSRLVAVGAMTAMLGVLLNLILGLSRVLLAMGRRADMPPLVARLDSTGSTPYFAVILVGIAIAGLAMLGSVHTTWSFSAFTVLIYYAITNFCALRLRDNERFYPRWIAGIGLTACLGLAFFVERQFWLTGIGFLAGGALWFAAARIFRRQHTE